MSLPVTGLLIQAVPGILGALGAAGEAPRVRGAGGLQHGLAACSWIAAAVPVWTEYGVCSPIPECRCSWL